MGVQARTVKARAKDGTNFPGKEEGIMTRKPAPAPGIPEKLKVLGKIAAAFEEQQILWAVGASLLLWFKGKVPSFQDIDLMVYEPDLEKARAALEALGTLQPPKPQGRYRTRHFLEFLVEGVEVDLMAGLVILAEGREWDCSLTPDQVAEYYPLAGRAIPLQSLELWKRYYALMGRPEKARLLEE